MELLGDAPLPLTLAVLALLDGLSVGTLLIPVFLLLAPGRVRAARILLYLATIAVFYLGIGVLFLLGLVSIVDVAVAFLASPVGTVLRLAVGAGLLLTGILMGSGAKKPVAVGEGDPAEPAGSVPTSDSRILRWRDRLVSAETSPATVMGVAVAAGVAEVATMLPYLVAMGALAEASLTTPLRIAALAGYCVVMILPAIVLLLLRIVAARAVERPLARFAAWMERTGRENTAWIVGIVGFVVLRGAANELGLFERLTDVIG